MTLSETIKELALSLGFDACGIAKAEPLELDGARLKTWIDAGRHGQMRFMEQYMEMREDPTILMEGCRSMIMVLINYNPSNLQPSNAPQIAKYAYGKDYHWVIKERLQKLLEEIQKLRPDVVGRVFTDSAPIMERSWARRAGLGFIGKNNLLIHPKIGAYTFIGSLMVNIDLDYDEPVSQHCGSCQACIEHCPTGALAGAHWFDARKCLSYLSIEHRGSLSEDEHRAMGNRLYGCDNCLDCCPWNQNAPKSKHT